MIVFYNELHLQFTYRARHDGIGRGQFVHKWGRLFLVEERRHLKEEKKKEKLNDVKYKCKE